MASQKSTFEGFTAVCIHVLLSVVHLLSYCSKFLVACCSSWQHQSIESLQVFNCFLLGGHEFKSEKSQLRCKEKDNLEDEKDEEVFVPRPVQIVVANEEEHSFSLQEAVLEQLLLQEEVQDLNVVVVSVAGAFRKGKSFLLDFMLRYMYRKVF